MRPKESRRRLFAEDRAAEAVRAADDENSSWSGSCRISRQGGAQLSAVDQFAGGIKTNDAVAFSAAAHSVSRPLRQSGLPSA